MCWCTPEMRTPFCGRPRCHPPVATPASDPCVVQGCKAGKWQIIGADKQARFCEVCNRCLVTATLPENPGDFPKVTY